MELNAITQTAPTVLSIMGQQYLWIPIDVAQLSLQFLVHGYNVEAQTKKQKVNRYEHDNDGIDSDGLYDVAQFTHGIFRYVEEISVLRKKKVINQRISHMIILITDP